MGARYNKAMMIIVSFLFIMVLFLVAAASLALKYIMERRDSIELLFNSLNDIKEINTSLKDLQETVNSIPFLN